MINVSYENSYDDIQNYLLNAINNSGTEDKYIFLYPDKRVLVEKESTDIEKEFEAQYKTKAFFLDNEDINDCGVIKKTYSLYNTTTSENKRITLSITEPSILGDIINLLSFESFKFIFIQQDLFDIDIFKLLYLNSIPFNYIMFAYNEKTVETFIERLVSKCKEKSKENFYEKFTKEYIYDKEKFKKIFLSFDDTFQYEILNFFQKGKYNVSDCCFDSPIANFIILNCKETEDDEDNEEISCNYNKPCRNIYEVLEKNNIFI